MPQGQVREDQERSTTAEADQDVSARQAAQRAARHLEEMTGQPPEVVTAVERDGDGWSVRVEVLELARIPETTDVLGCYEVVLGADGEPTGYRRVRRYHRGRVGDE